jgi:hypothetical protein
MVFHKKSAFCFVPVSIALVASSLLVSQNSEARPPRAAQSQEKVSVVGHLDLQGMPVKQMFLQQRGGKSYVFLRRADQNAFAIVDVTNPASPVLTDKGALKEPSGTSVELPAPGSAVAIAFIPERPFAPAASAPVSDITLPTETVRLIDLSDPRHPKTIKVFDKVSSLANDDGRKLVLLVNNEGLWIVSHHRNRPLPMCTSESAIESQPDCQ